eukprot:878967-Prymnesium_polylepis.1
MICETSRRPCQIMVGLRVLSMLSIDVIAVDAVVAVDCRCCRLLSTNGFAVIAVTAVSCCQLLSVLLSTAKLPRA